MGMEATATLKRISSRLATKWRQPYSKTCGYVKSRVAITLVRATHRCLRGSQVPAHQISVQRPQWEDGAGLNLFWLGTQITTLTPFTLLPTPPPLSNLNKQTTQPTENPLIPEIKQKKTGSTDSRQVAKEAKGGQGTSVLP